MNELKKKIKRLYTSNANGPRSFRWGLFIFDMTLIAYFLATATIELSNTIIAIDITLGVILLAEFSARHWVLNERKTLGQKLYAALDLIVILSLFAPLLFKNIGFLRILRTLRFLHSYHTIKELRRLSKWFRKNERVVTAATNLIVFVFIVTSIVWVLEARINPNINSYIDALYFTVTTLTTTGYGDIILQDDLGRVLTILIMVFGVALFLRLVQQIFRPHKIEHKCKHCGLKQHDPDASHCKHCGNIVNIETDGEV
ncbi:MAG: ion transporter [Rhizobiales bacterium]|nr:ion transporter [Hyphomicrobiales bacterium]